MKELSSCKESINRCLQERYFSVAHLYKEEKVMEMHIHDCYEIYYSISGGQQFLIGNVPYKIEPGDFFVINQFESHHLTQYNEMVHERIVISIHPDFLKEISSETTDLTYCFTHRPTNFSHRLVLNKEQQRRFLYYADKITYANDFGHDLIEKSAFLELMVLLTQVCMSVHESDEIPVPGVTFNNKADDILAFINQNVQSPITIESLASHFYLSDSYICRIFKNATGMTVNKYITGRRIAIAKALLADGLNVNQVYKQCGFNDYSNFFKVFTKAVGISPKKYSQCSTS